MVSKPSLKHTLLRLAGNVASILSNDVLNRATSFALYALVARYLGAFSFGQLSLALSLFYTFQVFAEAGLQTLITREVTKDRSQTDLYLINGSVLALFASIAASAILFVFVWLMGYAADTAAVILVLSLGLFPYALAAICEAIFQAWERMHYIAYANVPMNIVKVGLAFLLLSHGAGVYTICVLLLATRIGIAVLEWGLMLRCITRPQLQIDYSFMTALLTNTRLFFGIDSSIAIWSSLNVVLLSKLIDETAVGYYSAVTQLLAPVMMVFHSIVVSVFPTLCRKFGADIQQLRGSCESLLELLLAIALPSAVGLFFLAEPLLVLLYGKAEFAQAAGVLRILAWDLVLIALTHALGQVLLAGMREKLTLQIVVSNIVIHAVLGLVLIPQFGLLGAAVASFATRFVGLVQHYVSVTRLVPQLSVGQLVWKPVVASACLVACLTLLQGQHVMLTIVSSGSLYVLIFGLLFVGAHGGLQQMKLHYLSVLSD